MNRRLLKRRLSAFTLGALGTGCLIAASLEQRPAPAQVDYAAVDSYLAQLSVTTPRPPGAGIAKVAPPSEVSATSAPTAR
jgi:hypothetical protein